MNTPVKVGMNLLCIMSVKTLFSALWPQLKCVYNTRASLDTWVASLDPWVASLDLWVASVHPWVASVHPWVVSVHP